MGMRSSPTRRGPDSRSDVTRSRGWLPCEIPKLCRGRRRDPKPPSVCTFTALRVLTDPGLKDSTEERPLTDDTEIRRHGYWTLLPVGRGDLPRVVSESRIFTPRTVTDGLLG